jgi:flagellar biosynthetic protein FliO
MIFLLQLIQQATPPEDINFGPLVLRMFLFLGLILLLIVVVMRKVLPMLVPGRQFQRTKTISVLERVPIDQRKSLLVVEIQDKIYLLGSAEGQINILMELDREKVLSEEHSSAKTISFSEILKKKLSREKPS